MRVHVCPRGQAPYLVEATARHPMPCPNPPNMRNVHVHPTPPAGAPVHACAPHPRVHPYMHVHPTRGCTHTCMCTPPAGAPVQACAPHLTCRGPCMCAPPHLTCRGPCTCVPPHLTCRGPCTCTPPHLTCWGLCTCTPPRLTCWGLFGRNQALTSKAPWVAQCCGRARGS